MQLHKISREWVTDSKHRKNYFLTTLYMLGIPVVRLKRTDVRIISILGIPVYRSRIRKQSLPEALMHLLSVSLDVRRMPAASGLLRTFQLAELELLKKVDRVCKKHGIQYWLDYGTLLGAVRHKGFIPWDDDVDISMMREDYEKFISICKDEFPEECYSINSVGFLQIHVRNTKLQVDVFPYDQAATSWMPEGEQETSFIQRLYDASAQFKYDIKLGQDREDCITNYNYEERRVLHREAVMQGTSPSPDGNVFLGIETSAIVRFTLKYDWMFPLKFIPYEDGLYPVPNVPEMFLYMRYGDWEAIPRNPYFHFDLSRMSIGQYGRLLEIAKNGL